MTNLEIKRLQGEMEAPIKSEFEDGKVRYTMPPQMKRHAIDELNRLLEDVKQNKISSIMISAVWPQSEGEDKGNVIVCVADQDVEKLGELVAMAFQARMDATDPEAG